MKARIGKVATLLSAISGLALFGAFAPVFASGLAVRGLALDSERAPINGARVELIPTVGPSPQGLRPEPAASATTDPLGLYTLTPPAAGVFTVRIMAPGKETLTFSPVLVAAETELPAALLPSVAIAVSRPQEGIAIDEITEITEIAEEPPLRGWRLERLPLQPASRKKRTEGRGPEIRALSGRVLKEEDGGPLAGALVWSPDDPATFAVSDAGGRYSVRAPDAVTIWLQARAPGRLARRVLLDPGRLGAGRATTFTLAREGSLAGRATDSAGRPLAGVAIRSLPLRRDGTPLPVDGHAILPSASTGPDGTFRLTGLKPGEPALLRAEKRGFLPVSLERSVPRPDRPGDSGEPVLLVLPAARAATGRIVDEAKRPLAGARVRVAPSSFAGSGARNEPAGARAEGGADFSPLVLSDAAGRFTVAEIPGLELDVGVTRPGSAPTLLRRFRAAPGGAPVQLGDITLHPGAALTGIVTDEKGKPLPGARVYRLERMPRTSDTRPLQEVLATLRAKRPQALSGADGKFRIDGLRRGEPVHLLVAAAGHLSAALRGVLPPPATPLRIALARGTELAGRVFDPEGRPVAGASLALTWRAILPGREDIRVGTPVVRSATSDGEGRFRFTEMPAGGARLAVSAAGFQPIEETAVTLSQPPGEEARVVLERGAIVEGTVTDTGGEAVSGVRVVAGPASGTSDEAGLFRVDGVRPGALAIEAVHPLYPRFRRRLQVEAGTNHLDVVLTAGTTVSGRVVDGTGVAVSGALAVLESAERNEAKSYQARSEAGGGITFSQVAAGSYRLRASARGYASGESARTVLVGREPVAGVEIALAAGGSIEGRILGLAADELSSVALVARHESGVSESAEIDAAGSYAFGSLRPGGWLLEATLREGERSARARVLLAEGGEEDRDLRFGEGLTLSGRILYRGEPLADARVSLRGLQLAVERGLTTSYDGTFLFEDLGADSYQLGVIQSMEQVAHNEIVPLAADREMLIDLRRQTVAGRVTDSSSGKPVGGAVVALRHVAGAEGPEFLIADGSGPSGTFAIERVPPGRYRLAVSHEGYAQAEREILVPEGEDLGGVDVRLQPAQGAELSIRRAAGGVPPLVHLRILSPAGVTVIAESRPLDATGRIRLSTLPAGQWTVLASGTRSALGSAQLAVPGKPLDVVLPEGARLAVRIPALATSDAIGRLQVRSGDGRALETLEMGGALKQEWPLIAGAVTLEAVPAGSWTLSAQAPDGRSWTATVGTDGRTDAQVSLE